MRRAVLAVLCAALVTPACAKGGDDTDDRLTVVTGVYPFRWLVEQVGGDRVRVVDVTPPGAEPHDVELTPTQVGRVEQADLIVLAPGLQPALDDAAPDDKTLDALRVLGGIDPHVWLDVVGFGDVGTELATRLSALDREHERDYAARAETVNVELARLHTQITDGLARCRRRDLVTSHEAFGRFAARHDLRATGIKGVDDEAEASPRRIADVARLARERGVTTVFGESLEDGTARTVAREAGATLAVLDPIEVRPEGLDYLAAMRRNLDRIRTALGCP